jgi:hypothetical protein
MSIETRTATCSSRTRSAIQGVVLGAFGGYLCALLAARLELGFGADVTWAQFLYAVRKAQPLTVPLGAALDVLGGLVNWHRTRMSGSL